MLDVTVNVIFSKSSFDFCIIGLSFFYEYFLIFWRKEGLFSNDSVLLNLLYNLVYEGEFDIIAYSYWLFIISFILIILGWMLSWAIILLFLFTGNSGDVSNYWVPGEVIYYKLSNDVYFVTNLSILFLKTSSLYYYIIFLLRSLESFF